MRLSHIRTIIVLFCIMIIGGASINSKESHSKPNDSLYFKMIDSILIPWVDADGPGASVLVVKDGRPVFSKGYGLANLEHGIANAPNTSFNLGSLAKQFTAFGIAMLTTEGKISLDDDIHEYVPELPDFGHEVTVQHLINHTSGLPDEFSLLQMCGYWYDDAVTTDQVMKLIESQTHLLFTPGEKWEYCNTGYTILAKIIENVTGVSFKDWCRENIFEPLEMTHTAFVDDHQTVIPNRASSYNYHASGWKYVPVNYSNVGCTNLYSTIEDIAKWIDNYWSGKVGGSNILSLIARTGLLNDSTETDYAFGQFKKPHRGHVAYQHSGSIGAYKCALIIFPEENLGIACLSNAGYFTATEVARQVADVYLIEESETSCQEDDIAAEVMPSAESKETSEPVILSKSIIESYVGLYQLESTLKAFRITGDSSGLALLYLSEEPFQLEPITETEFRLRGFGSTVSFIMDDSGIVTGFDLLIGSLPNRANKIIEAGLTEIQMKSMIGDYYSAELQTACRIELIDGALFCIHFRHPDNPLTPVNSSELVGEQKWLRTVNFKFGKTGEIIGFYGSSAFARDIWFTRIASEMN